MGTRESDRGFQVEVLSPSNLSKVHTTPTSFLLPEISNSHLFRPPMASSSSLLLSFLFLVFLISSSLAEIKEMEITDDSRTLILFEKFGFTHGGHINISISSASFSPSDVDPSLLGFFIISDESLLRAASAVESRPSCLFDSPYIMKLFLFGDLSHHSYSKSFPINHPDEYSLFFASCARNSHVSMSVRTSMYNLDSPSQNPNFLPVGKSPLPVLFSVFAICYLVFLVVWIHICLIRSRLFAHKIHLLMGLLLLAKLLNLLFAAEDQHYIRTTGTPHGWDVLFYLFQFLKGVLLFTVIVLVGTGWSFLKPFLQDREKKVLMVVIPLQVLANIARVAVDEMSASSPTRDTWNQLLLLVDIACCCAVLFPIVWSIRSLKEASKTDGKAARNLSKLTLFRRFYVIVVGYLYFTRIVVYALKTIASYKYAWVSVAAGEAASLAFYIVMFQMFAPVERNQYFAIDDDDEEAAAATLREEDFEL